MGITRLELCSHQKNVKTTNHRALKLMLIFFSLAFSWTSVNTVNTASSRTWELVHHLLCLFVCFSFCSCSCDYPWRDGQAELPFVVRWNTGE